MSAPSAGKRKGRSVPVLYGGATTALLLAVVGLALSSPPPRTPPLAAVNPQVEEQVEVERVEQSSQFGQGAGGEGDCSVGADCVGLGQEQAARPGEVPTPRTTSAPADLWPCVLGPGGPRQTDDPQSPPCIGERFKGGNGGATWRGVTPTEIRIGYRTDSFWTSQQGNVALPAFVSHFNRHYELYGRQIVLVEVGTGRPGTDPAEQRAAAEEVAGQEVFATLDYGNFGAHHQRLAQLGIVTFTKSPLISESDVTALHPHVWSLYPAREQALEVAGEVICVTLKGRPAQHGGDAVEDTPRRFGIVETVPASDGVHYPAGELASRLRACGADHKLYRFDEKEENESDLLTRMRRDGITTISCVCATAGIGQHSWMAQADALAYEPEWFGPGVSDAGLYVADRPTTESTPRSQMAHVFGIAGGLRLTEGGPVSVNRYGVHREHFWYHAAKAENPSFDPNYVPSRYYDVYGQLLMLASGIQWAGPDLNPETFGAALTGLRYPNPGVGISPWYQPSVGFGPSDHAFNSDFALYWWQNPTEEEWQSKTHLGVMCYVGGGRRFTTEGVPANVDDLLFDPEAGCR
ncbi:MAG: hypothetical protein WEB19_03630 [Acidimicrobiia bacterium]